MNRTSVSSRAHDGLDLVELFLDQISLAAARGNIADAKSFQRAAFGETLAKAADANRALWNDYRSAQDALGGAFDIEPLHWPELLPEDSSNQRKLAQWRRAAGLDE